MALEAPINSTNNVVGFQMLWEAGVATFVLPYYSWSHTIPLSTRQYLPVYSRTVHLSKIAHHIDSNAHSYL